MNRKTITSAADAEFHLKIRQALFAAKHSVRQVALLLISLDESAASSTHSQETLTFIADTVLARLRNSLRESDTVSKLAPKQIGVLLPSLGGREDIDQIVKRLLSIIMEPFPCEQSTLALEPRVGVAIFPEHSSDVSSLLQRAEEALNRAKLTNCVYALYSSETRPTQGSRYWMAELRQAIVSDQLCLCYQPKVNLAQSRMTGVEILTRWQHPELGTIEPDKFIPVAERTGLIIPLTLWVLQQGLMQCRTWADKGIDLPIAVNLTMWNLETPELPDQVESLLRDTGVPANKLEFEITETAIMNDPERTIRALSQMRELGVRFAIDDFGTGYSSFAYLRKLPVSSIKIDKSFILNIESDRDSGIIVRSIVDLGHNLGLKVVAEGVETFESQKVLRSFDCDEGQGFYFGRPLPADALSNSLAERSTSKCTGPGDRGNLYDPSLIELGRDFLNSGNIKSEFHEE
jgi:EAL domain-containing protein (putative c-di-GMP-specific phosphodiesterase class I)/GGDEF domain-containing protein